MGALQQAMAMPDGDRAGRLVRASLYRSASQPDGTDLTVRAIRLWLHEYGAAVIETDPAWVVELLFGLTTLSDTDDVPAWLQRVRQAHPGADGELTALGLQPHHLGEETDAVVIQTDHSEYSDLTPADIPGARLVINGRPGLGLDLGGKPNVVVVGNGRPSRWPPTDA